MNDEIQYLACCMVSSCIICGDCIPLSEFQSADVPRVCVDCKEAMKFAKELLAESKKRGQER